MANGTASQVTDDEWEYHPAQKAATDDEWDYAPAKPAPNLRTGEGMEVAATDQAAKQTRQPLDRLREKETALSMFTPTGITRDVGDPELDRVRKAANVSSDVVGAMSMVPGAAGTIAERGLLGGAKVLGKGIARTALGGAAGATAGGYAGREVGGAFGSPEVGREIGAGIGGVTGGIAAGAFPKALPSEGRFGKVFDLLRPEAEPEFPGASLPSTDEFYAKRGADINAMRKLQPSAFAPKPEPFPGAPLPLADEFYENRGKDLMARGRQQSILDRAAAKPKPTPFGEGMTSTSGTLPDTPLPSITEGMKPAEMPLVQSRQATAPESVSIFPEPHEPMPGDRPGAMWSVGRESVLPEAAQRGAPGAGDVLRNIGKPIIYTPREGVGYPGPKSITEEGNAAPAPAPPPSITEPPTYKQSEKAATMSAKPRDLGPEWSAGELQHEIQRNKAIIRNPRATAEDIAIAKDRLRDAQAMAAPKQ